ncbi:MAG: branched-chain amino acid ABC transporter permease [Antricoccus sp.]
MSNDPGSFQTATTDSKSAGDSTDSAELAVGDNGQAQGSYSVTRPRTRVGRVVKIVATIAMIVVLFLVPIYATAAWMSVATWIMVGGVGAMGLTMLLGQAGQLSLANTFFLLVGGVSYSVFAGPTGDPTYVGFGLTPLLALVLAIIVSGLVGALFAPIAGRLSGIYLGVASLSLVFLGFYLGRVLPQLAGSTSSGRAPVQFGIGSFTIAPPNPPITLMGVPLGADERKYYLFVILTAIAYVLARGAIKGRIGRAWRAVRDNEAAATVLGVSVMGAKSSAFVVSSMYAGLSGVMTVWWYSLMKPDESEFGTFGVTQAIAFLAMVVIGGMGSLVGSILGSAVVFGLPLILTLLVKNDGVQSGTAFSPGVITNLIYGALIILIIMFEPRGLAGLGHRILALFRR